MPALFTSAQPLVSGWFLQATSQLTLITFWVFRLQTPGLVGFAGATSCLRRPFFVVLGAGGTRDFPKGVV